MSYLFGNLIPNNVDENHDHKEYYKFPLDLESSPNR